MVLLPPSCSYPSDMYGSASETSWSTTPTKCEWGLLSTLKLERLLSVVAVSESSGSLSISISNEADDIGTNASECLGSVCATLAISRFSHTPVLEWLASRERDIPGSFVAFTRYAQMIIRIIRRYDEAVGCSRGIHDATGSRFALWNLLDLWRDAVSGEASHEFILLTSKPGVRL